MTKILVVPSDVPYFLCELDLQFRCPMDPWLKPAASDLSFVAPACRFRTSSSGTRAYSACIRSSAARSRLLSFMVCPRRRRELFDLARAAVDCTRTTTHFVSFPNQYIRHIIADRLSSSGHVVRCVSHAVHDVGDASRHGLYVAV